MTWRYYFPDDGETAEDAQVLPLPKTSQPHPTQPSWRAGVTITSTTAGSANSASSPLPSYVQTKQKPALWPGMSQPFSIA